LINNFSNNANDSISFFHKVLGQKSVFFGLNLSNLSTIIKAIPKKFDIIKPKNASFLPSKTNFQQALN